MAPPHTNLDGSNLYARQQQDQQQQQFDGNDFVIKSRQQMMREPSKMVLNQNMHVLTKAEIDGFRKQGFTQGLAQAVASNRHHFALFIWIIDNSGSMSTSDVSSEL